MTIPLSKKNIFSAVTVFIFVFSLLLSASPAVSEASPHTISIQTVRGEAGDTVSVDVTASGIDMAGFALIINYDPEYLAPKDAELYIEEGHLQYFPDYGEDKISFAWWRAENLNVEKMFKVEFEIIKSISGVSRLFIDDDDINNEVLDEETNVIDVTYNAGGVRGRSSGDGSSGPCYIATAVYGSHYAPEVVTLRNFRDEVLQNSLAGRLFIKVYYALSPPVADYLAEAEALNGWVRSALSWFVDLIGEPVGESE